MTREDRHIDEIPLSELSPAEEAAYDLLVARSPATVADLAAHWVCDEPLADALAGLAARRLADRGPGDLYTALPSDIALDAWLVAHGRQQRAARAHIADLAAEYRSHAAVRRPVPVERADGTEVVARQLDALFQSVHSELRWLAGPNAAAGRGVAPVLDLLDRGVACRVIYPRGLLKDATIRDQIDQVTGRGGQVRTAPSLPSALHVADGRLALLAVEWDGPDLVAAELLYPGSLLDAARALFDGLWQYAWPIHGTIADSRLVDLLRAGNTDVAVARQLGTSHRTVARRVAELMSGLGAHTRFQAGVQAAALGVPHPDKR